MSVTMIASEKYEKSVGIIMLDVFQCWWLNKKYILLLRIRMAPLRIVFNIFNNTYSINHFTTEGVGGGAG